MEIKVSTPRSLASSCAVPKTALATTALALSYEITSHSAWIIPITKEPKDEPHAAHEREAREIGLSLGILHWPPESDTMPEGEAKVIEFDPNELRRPQDN